MHAFASRYEDVVGLGIALLFTLWLLWINIQYYGASGRAREAIRRAAMTQEEREKEDYEDWANRNSW
jgi:hypothetical protein